MRVKYVDDDFPPSLGVVTGIVGLVDALGGFVPPIIFGIVLDWQDINSSCFMFLHGVVWVSLILNYTTEVRHLDGTERSAQRVARTMSKRRCDHDRHRATARRDGISSNLPATQQ